MSTPVVDASLEWGAGLHRPSSWIAFVEECA